MRAREDSQVGTATLEHIDTVFNMLYGPMLRIYEAMITKTTRAALQW